MKNSFYLSWVTRNFSFSPRKIFHLSANGGAEKQNINLVPISQRRRYEYYINHSERPGLRDHIFWFNNYQGKLEFIQTKPRPWSHLSLPHPLPHFQHLLLDLLPCAHPQLPDWPHGGGVKRLHRGQTAAQAMPQWHVSVMLENYIIYSNILSVM